LGFNNSFCPIVWTSFGVENESELPQRENGLARGVLALGDDLIVGCVGMVRHLFVVRMTWTIPDEERELGLVTLFVRLFQIRSRQ